MTENLRFAFRGIKTHKMRSFLTMLGVIIGIASIIAIVSIVEGTSQQLQSNLVGSGNNVISIKLSSNGWEYEMGYEGVPDGVPMVSEETMEEIRNISGVEAATSYRYRTDYNSIFRGTKELGSGYIYGVDKNYFDTLQYKIVKGRGFSQAEDDGYTKAIIIDTVAQKRLFDTEDPIGKIVEVKSEPYTVVGVVNLGNDEEREYNSINDYYMHAYSNQSSAFVLKDTWPIVYQYDEPENVAVRVVDTDKMASVGKEVADILNKSVSSQTVKYSYLDASDNENTLNTITTYIQIMLVGIASLSLLVGGIGVMNIMLVSVTERTAEIGLKKALGAKKKNIMAQFLTESAALTGIGGVIGVVFGIILAKVITVVAGLNFTVSVPWVFIALGFSVFIGIVFGATPASKAANLSPIEALRRE